MNATNYLNNMPELNKLCRACLSTNDSFKYAIDDNIPAEKYFFCTSVQIFKDESLPKTICNICYDLLTKFSEFKSTCIQSNKILIGHKSIKSENRIILNESNDEEVNQTNINSDHGMDNLNLNNESSERDHVYENKYDYDVTIKQEEITDNIEPDFDITPLNEKPLESVKITKETKRVNVAPKRKLKYSCEICKKKFYCIKRFEVHKSSHQDKEKAIKCIPCNKTFMTWSGLKRHDRNWHVKISLNSVMCRYCGKIAKSRETLRAHEKLHLRKRKFICNICGKSYSTVTNLESHLETHKENRERQCTCEHCGKKFFTKKCLISHISRCHTGRRFICQICSYPFTDKYNLSKHLEKHEGKKFFTCNVCGKSFATQQVYVEHQRIHSGERPFHCTYCTKRFISKKRLTDHNRTHTGEKPYKCSVCEHRFTQRGTLTRHMKIHDRPPINN